MKPQELKERMRGVMAFAPMPFTADDRLDGDGLARQVDFLCRNGADVIVVCGGVAEFFSLTLDEYRDAIRIGADAAQKRVPLLAGIGHSTKTACALAAHAAAAGVDGLMMHPFYFVRPFEDGIQKHFDAVARASGLGLMIYHTPEAVYTTALVERLAQIEAVVALKDEVGDMKAFLEMRARLGDRLTWVNGMAELLLAPYLAAGAQSFTTGIVNFAPHISVEAWRLARAGDPSLFAFLNANVRPLAQLRARRPGYAIAVIKEAMNLLGLPGGQVRLPLTPVRDDDKEELRQLLVRLGLLA